MATIFQKITALGPDNTLILEPREALLYPFDFGNDWSEIRVGVFASMTSNISNNSPYFNEFILNTNSRTASYFGVKDSSLIFPSLSGSLFVGSVTPYNQQSLLQNETNTIDFNNDSIKYIIDNKFVPTTAGRADLAISSSSNGTGISSFCGFNGLRIKYDESRKIISGSFFNVNSQSDTSTSNARFRMSALLNQSPFITGFFTSDFTSSGSIIARPNAVFIYFPFFNNRLRIHNICVERYS